MRPNPNDPGFGISTQSTTSVNYVRPALKLDLSKVSFDSASKTFSLKVNVTGVNLNPPTATLTVGGDSVTLAATVEPADAMDKTVTWTTSNASVATVENGVVTAQGAGTATITATATNGTADTSDDKTATCAVTVNILTSKIFDTQPV